MAIIVKTRGANFRYLAVDTETGECLGEQVEFHNLKMTLRRKGYEVTANLLRPWVRA